MNGGGAKCNPRHGWLAAVLPASGTRFRALDAAFAATLREAGAELVDAQPDVELTTASALGGDARVVIVPFDLGDFATASPPEGRSPAVRAAWRVLRSLEARGRVRAARRTLARRGYERTRALFWDQERPLHTAGSGERPSPAERFPLGAVAIGERGAEELTLLARAAVDAGDRAGQQVALEPLRVASWGMLALGEAVVLRVTVGPARRQLEAQAEALGRLGRRAPALAKLLPTPLARGRTGIADWLAEPRLSGAPAPATLGDRLLAPMLDVLAELHAAGERRPDAGSPVADAEALAAAVAPTDVARLGELARGLEGRLADLPRSFAHGDFSPANVLLGGGELTGVVDWNKAKQGALPLLDLLNLLLTLEVARSGRSHGEVFVDYLLPWARAGGDDITRAFCARVGVDLRNGLLEDLAAAWWLDRHAQQVATYSDRVQRPAWLRENVERPLRALLAR